MNKSNTQTAPHMDAHNVLTCPMPICVAERKRLRALRGTFDDPLTAEDASVLDAQLAADAAEAKP